jgi:hypothetical protein
MLAIILAEKAKEEGLISLSKTFIDGTFMRTKDSKDRYFSESGVGKRAGKGEARSEK